MTPVPPLAQDAIALARAGDFEGALAKAKAALTDNPADGGLQMFAGLLHTRLFQLDEAVVNFRAAAELAPNDPAARSELIRALIATGATAEAEERLGRGGIPQREGAKLNAMLLAVKGEFAAAAQILGELVGSDPRDFESWNHLGAALLSAGQSGRAASAFSESLKLRPEQPAIWDKWVDAAIVSGAGEAALAEIEGQGRGDHAVPAARLLDRLDRPDAALERLEAHVAENPVAANALIALADMVERRNRVDAFAALVERIERLVPGSEKLPMLRAKLALRRKDFEAAREWARRSPPLADPGTRAQIIGEASDRLGDSAAAWAAYRAMNAEDARANSGGQAEAAAYLGELEQETAALTGDWAGAWRPSEPPPASPIVLLGFPRSGTTLLDTFLGANPAVRIAEEYPLLPTVSHAAGPVADLPALSEARVAELRALYWSTADRHVPDRGALRLVDKYPFALVAAPYVERLFPGAPFLFVERHPCDVVLSCYFTRFQPLGAAAAFLDLHSTARLYDAMMRFWTRSRELLPLNVLDVRYERMVADPTAATRAVADYLGLPWTDAMTENQAAAERRGHIKTPSYAQVAEPVYDRSVERWRRYEGELAAVLPMLEPWARKLGYSL